MEQEKLRDKETESAKRRFIAARWDKRLATAVILAGPLLFALSVQANPVIADPSMSSPVTLLSSAQQASILSLFHPAKKNVTIPKAPPGKVSTMLVTAYTRKDKGMDGRGITTSEKPVQEGVTIAAPPDIPFGSKIYIPALNHTYTVTDRGGDIKGDRLDLFMESWEGAMEFGKQRLEVVITVP